MNALTIQNQDVLTQGGQINLLMFFLVASSLCVHRSSAKKFYSASLSASLKITFTCAKARSPKAVSRFEAKVPEHGPWGWILLL